MLSFGIKFALLCPLAPFRKDVLHVQRYGIFKLERERERERELENTKRPSASSERPPCSHPSVARRPGIPRRKGVCLKNWPHPLFFFANLSVRVMIIRNIFSSGRRHRSQKMQKSSGKCSE